jgi:CRISPR type III-associated protein (TIGR04423 family)
MIIKKIQLNEIPIDCKYEGYLWKSDADAPLPFINKTLPPWIDETANPFIIEGNLYNAAKDISYSIRYVDGEYLVHSFEMQGSVMARTDKRFLKNRIDGIEYLYFRQYWKPEPDEFCENMEVLKPSANVFVGFNHKEI